MTSGMYNGSASLSSIKLRISSDWLVVLKVRDVRQDDISQVNVTPSILELFEKRKFKSSKGFWNTFHSLFNDF